MYLFFESKFDIQVDVKNFATIYLMWNNPSLGM